MHRCQKVIISAFDVSACVILAIKLQYAESDEIVAYIESYSKQDSLAWMQGDLFFLEDVKPCLKYIESVVYDKGEVRTDSYQIKV